MLTSHIAYLCKMWSSLKSVPELNNLTGSDKSIHYLKDNIYDYPYLFSKDQNGYKLSVITDNSICSRQIHSNLEYILPTDEFPDATYFSKHHREQMRLSINQNLLISVAWVTPFDGEYFSLFLKVIFIDSA